MSVLDPAPSYVGTPERKMIVKRSTESCRRTLQSVVVPESENHEAKMRTSFMSKALSANSGNTQGELKLRGTAKMKKVVSETQNDRQRQDRLTAILNQKFEHSNQGSVNHQL